MSNRYLARLRVARVRCNENIARIESSLAFQRSRRDALEATIHDLEPELRLPAPNRKPNLVFARNEITELVLDVPRDAGEALGAAETPRARHYHPDRDASAAGRVDQTPGAG